MISHNLKKYRDRSRHIMLFAVMIFFMSFLFSLLFFLFCNQTAAVDMVHLGLVGQWNNDYGDFYGVRVWEYETIQNGNVVKKKYAFCTTSKGIVIFDIGKRSVASFLPLGECLNIEIAVSDKSGKLYGYITVDEAGLYIINVDDPQKPYYIAKCDTPFRAKRLAVSGDYAFITGSSNRLLVINIYNKNNPVIFGSCKTPYFVQGIAISEDGDFAFIVNARGGFRVINIKNKSNPRIIAGCNTLDHAKDIAISEDGSYAFITITGSGLQIINIANKNAPRTAGNCNTPGNAESVAISDDGNYAFVADGERGLSLIDISYPNNPILITGCNTDGYAKDIDISNNYAFIADWDHGLQIININNIINPYISFSLEAPAQSRDISVTGSYAFVVLGESGLQVIDIDNRSGPRGVGWCDTPGHAGGVAISDDNNYVFIADGESGLQVININDKCNPGIVGSCDTPGHAEGVAISDEGNYVFIADGESGLQVIDINDIYNPRIAGSYDTHGYAASLTISGDGNYAFVSDGESGLQVIDISDPNNPVLVGNYNTAGYAQGVAISGDGNYAFVADGESGLQIIDISDPNYPMLIGNYDTPGHALGVAVSGDGRYAFVADRERGLQIIDISDPNYPKLTGNYNSSGMIVAVAISAGYIFLADSKNGLLKSKIIIGHPQKGNLILVAGGGAGSENTLWPATQSLANHVFSTFIKAGYEVYDIWYQNPVFQDIFHSSLDQLVVDDPTPTCERLKQAIEPNEIISMKWKRSLRANIGPLYIYLIGHGAEDSFQIMPNEVLNAQELKQWIDAFTGITKRQVVVIIESAASGTFINDLIDIKVTAIASTNDGASYIKPVSADPNDPILDLLPSGQTPMGYSSFTTTFINGLEPYLAVFNNSQRFVNSNLREVFLAARRQLQKWAESGLPFSDQAPQMAIPVSEFTSLYFSKDGKKPLDHLTLNSPINDIPSYLTLIGQDPNGSYIPYSYQNITFFSYDPNILDPDSPDDIESYIDNNTIPFYEISPRRNGIFSLNAYPDPNIAPTILVSAKLTIEVAIDDPSYAVGEKNVAMIIAGYQGSGDYLWESTNFIGNHAYQTLRAMGYAEDEIYYFNPYLLQDFDKDNEYDEIRGYPELKAFDLDLPSSPFWEISQNGAKELFLFLVDHGKSGEFCLNPKESLYAELFFDALEAIAGQIDGKIIFLYDACYSGSFINEIEQREDSVLSQKLIAITSTDPNQTAYFLNQGMVSFSYPFFDEWLLIHSLFDAFDYSKYFLTFQGQTPCIFAPNLNHIAAWDRENIYYVDESRPSIIEAEAHRAGGQVKISAKVYSLTGVSKVFALVESTHNALTSTLGQAKVTASELILAPDSTDQSFIPNYPYGGPYTLTIPDPCPNETNYIIALYALDKSSRPKIANYNIPIGTSIKNATLAVIIYSDPNLFPQDEGARLHDQIIRVENILRRKGLVDDDIVKVSSLSDLSGIGYFPEGKTLFLYLIGSVEFMENGEGEIPHFSLNFDESLTPSNLRAVLPQDPNQRFLVLLDAPYARDFLSSAFNTNTWPERGAGIASTSRERLFFPPVGYEGDELFPCFSNFFFSAILYGATVAQSYRMAEQAVSLTMQEPVLFLPEAIEDYQTMNRHLSYYIGRSAISGEDYSLFTGCTAKAESSGKYRLSLTPHPEAEINRAWVVLTTSSVIYQKSMIVDLDPNNQACQESGDEYYQAYFMVEGKREGNSNISLTEWQQVAIAHIGDGIGDDRYEPDPNSDPELKAILWNPNHELMVNTPPIRRTFYGEDYMSGTMCPDIDWMYFWAQEGHIYEIYAQDLSELGYFIRIAIYDPNIRPVPQDQNMPDGPFFVARNLLTFFCKETGYYLLKTRLASSYPQGGVTYILSIIDPQAEIFTPSLIEITDLCSARLYNLSCRISKSNGQYLYPDISSLNDLNNSKEFEFGGTKPWEEFNIEIYYPHALYGNTINKSGIIKTLLVSSRESNLANTSNKRTIDLSSIPCPDNDEVAFPLPSMSYSRWVKDWQGVMKDSANPLLLGDTDLNLPPMGDYDEDGMINFMEYHLATSPINPTISLPLDRGENLYYFPAIDEGNPITVPNNVLLRPYYAFDQSRGAWYYSDNNKHFQRVCYYYDPDENTWHEEENCLNFVDAFTNQTFNALNAKTFGFLYLDLYDPLSPILYLRGFSSPWSFDCEAINPAQDIDTELFNPNEFNHGLRIKEILHNLGKIETISCPNKRTGRIDSTYHFFGKSTGDNSDIRQDAMYIIYKKGRIP